MKKVRLSGKYSFEKASSCDFEDIHLFLRMASNAKNSCGEVEVATVDVGTILFSTHAVQAWRIVEMDNSNNMVMAVRYSKRRHKHPVIYDVLIHEKTGEPVLVRRNFQG